ncbi:MAG: PKD domain-containing protein, partial [Acidobacteriota bacterium]
MRVHRFLALLALAGSTGALAQNATTGVGATASATFECVGVVATIFGDANGNGVANLEVRPTGGTFVPAHPLTRIDATRFVGSVFFLTPGTGYEVRVTLGDPDGVTNPVLTAQATTRPNAFPSANGSDYYVAPGGSDGNTGGIGDPWATVAHAAAVAQPGDEVFLRGGIYYESVDLVRSGTPTAPIVFRAYPGETAAMDGADPALVSSPGSWTNQGGGVWSVPLAAGTSYVAVDSAKLYPYQALADLQGLIWGTDGGFFAGGGTLYVRFPGGGTPTGVNVYVSRFPHAFNADGLTDLRFRDLEIRHYGLDDTSKGIYLRYASNCVVDGCHIHHNIAAVWLKGDASDNVIERCVIHDGPSQTWDWDASKAAGNVETSGVVFDSTWSGTRNVIRNNEMYDDFDGSHFCGDTHTTVDDTDIYGNSFHDLNDDGFETDGYCINVRIWGNTFQNTLMSVSLASAVTGPTYVLRNLMIDYGNTASGSQFTGAPFKFNVSGQPPSGPIFLYHNTCSSATPVTDAWLIKDLSQWAKVTTRDNIFSANDYGYRYDNTANDPVDFDWDLIYTSTPNHFANVQGTRYDTLALFQTGTGLELQGISAPPQFQNPAAGDYTLAAGSPAIDRGTPIPGIDDGFVGTAPDLGAFERGSGAPNADFTGTPLVGAAPLAVQLTDASSGAITTWAWTFGDGATSATQSPAHTYVAPGSYDVALTVTGPGGTDTMTKAGYVTVTGGAPQANYFSGRGRGQPDPNDVAVHVLGGTRAATWIAYASGQWGTLVGEGDVDGDATSNPLTGPGPGPVYGPQVRAWQPSGTPIAKVNFYAYGTLRYGVNVS